MGMNGRGGIKGFVFSSITLLGRYRSQGGKRFRIKRKRVHGSRGRTDLWLGCCGHMIGHMTTQCPEQSLPGLQLHSKGIKASSNFVMSLKIEGKACCWTKKPHGGWISLCGPIWQSAFSAAYEKILAGWKSWDPGSQVSAQHPHPHLGSCLLCPLLISERPHFFKKNEKMVSSDKFTCQLVLVGSPLRTARWWNVVGRTTANLRWEREKSENQQESKGVQNMSAKTGNVRARREWGSSLPPANIPTGMWKNKVSLLGPSKSMQVTAADI